jgi:hypothetical protein
MIDFSRSLALRAAFAAMILVGTDAQAADGGGFRIGASAMVGIVHPVNLAIDAKLGQRLSLGAAGGVLNLSGSGVNVRIINYEGRARFHPFAGPFFLGAIVGNQVLSASAGASAMLGSESVQLEASLTTRTVYATPHLGWMWLIGKFLFGLEAGWQFPLSNTSSFNVSVSDSQYQPYLDQIKGTPEYQKLQSDAENLGNQVGGRSLPYFTLLRIGFMF